MENQLTILAESLEKKKQVLTRIQEYNVRQEQIFTQESVDMDAFDVAVQEKGELIEALTKLDAGFELLYARLAAQLKDNRTKYAAEIKELQKKVTEITDMSVAIQVQEKRNKQLIEKYFTKEKAKLQENRKTSKAAYDYYKRVNNIAYAPPQFMDSKQ